MLPTSLKARLSKNITGTKYISTKNPFDFAVICQQLQREGFTVEPERYKVDPVTTLLTTTVESYRAYKNKELYTIYPPH